MDFRLLARGRRRKNRAGNSARIRVGLKGEKTFGKEAVMSRSIRCRWLLAVGIGLMAGLALSGLWPQSPLYAVSTDRTDTYAIATGPLDTEVEAVFILDFLTGDLKAIVVGQQGRNWSGYFHANVAHDMQIDPQKNPKFMMVTGVVALRRAGGSRLQPSNSTCYVAEATTGQIAAYVIAWSPSMYKANQPQSGEMNCIAVARFRQAAGEAPVVPEPGPRRGR
jgi:hypothetical protein